MFGRILSIYDQMIILENNAHKVEASLIGVHVVFEEKYKIVCEISKIDADIIECVMVGEFVNGVFNSGIVHKPTNTATIRIVNKDEVIALVGSQKVDSDTDLYIGKSLIYEGFNISARIDDFFSNHFAIIGNTGSGKSCSIARIFQNLFYRREYVPVNANIVLFDVYGEYHSALEKINQTNSCRCKSLTTDITNTKYDIVKIPPYFLEVDDLALLLGITSPAQLPIIEKALKYVYLFTEDEEKVINFVKEIEEKRKVDIETDIEVKKINEPKKVNKEFDVIYQNVSKCELSYSFKLPINDYKIPYHKLDLYLYIIFISNLGKLTGFGLDLKEKNLINGNIGIGTNKYMDYIVPSINVSTDYPEKIIDILDKKIKEFSLNEEYFNMIKKSMISDFVYCFTGVSNVMSYLFGSYANNKKILTTDFKDFQELKFEELKEVFNKLNLDNKSILIMKPLEEKE
mgnify:CR=1 FL=1